MRVNRRQKLFTFTLRPGFPDAQRAIDAEFDACPIVYGFNVNVVGADLDRFFDRRYRPAAHGVFVELTGSAGAIGKKIGLPNDVRRHIARFVDAETLPTRSLRNRCHQGRMAM